MTERRWFLPMHTITAGNHDNNNIKITFNVLLEGDLSICRLRNLIFSNAGVGEEWEHHDMHTKFETWNALHIENTGQTGLNSLAS